MNWIKLANSTFQNNGINNDYHQGISSSKFDSSGGMETGSGSANLANKSTAMPGAAGPVNIRGNTNDTAMGNNPQAPQVQNESSPLSQMATPQMFASLAGMGAHMAPGIMGAIGAPGLLGLYGKAMSIGGGQREQDWNTLTDKNYKPV